jgi:hypothetical protein
MELRTITSTWYEIVLVGGYGAKLNNSYASKQAAEKAAIETNLRAVQNGYGPSKYYIMYCTIVRLMEDNGDCVSETITRTRV